MSYFQDNKKNLHIETVGIRNCQRGAFYAVLSHFTRFETPCLIGMPTGSGKTALMMTLAFGLGAKRLLVITPSKVLRKQTATKFSSLEDLKSIGALTKSTMNPKVMEAFHEFRTIKDWNNCSLYDVVVATPKTTSPIEGKVIIPPPDIFDLLIIDEAHHAPASTWDALIQAFNNPKTKIVLMTGTPYRRDQIEIDANLVYDYPIKKAISDGIFAPVKFVSAGKQTTSRDKSLARKAITIREKIYNDYAEQPLLFIKTDRINHANELVKIYQDYGLNVPAIHSNLDDNVNNNLIKELSSNKIDGIVTVGMVGEGLDVPRLKLAVFHRNPQSLPHTIQLIGRLARVGTKISQGVIIGYQDDFSRETFALYDSSPDWFKLIPALERKLISGRVGNTITSNLSENEDFLFETDIHPFFTVSVFKWVSNPKPVAIDCIKGWQYYSKDLRLSIERISIFENDTTIVITKRLSSPNWVKTGGYSRILQEDYGLHIFFQYKSWILQYTTDDQLASKIRSKIFSGQLKVVNSNHLNKVMDVKDSSYLVVGMKNSGGGSLGNPSYKMLMGRDAQASVSNSDTKTFHAGHCLMRLDRNSRNSEVRGIAYKKGRIWALKRDNIRMFREWCLGLVSGLEKQNAPQLPNLERLRSREIIEQFLMKPLAIMHNTSLLTLRTIFINNGNGERSEPPDISVDGFSNGVIKFSFPELEIVCTIEIDKEGLVSYTSDSDDEYSIEVDPVEGVIKRYSVLEFFNEFPPSVVFPDGSTLVDNFYSKPSTIPELDSSVISPINWKGCDIHSELDNTTIGSSVQKYIEDLYLARKDKHLLIINDHKSYEIADLIVIDLLRNHITLIHTKSAGITKGVPDKPGGRKSDLEEVVSHAISSSKWIKHANFAREIERRINDRDATKIIQGELSQVQEFLSEYSPALFGFQIDIVQPALRSDKISESINAMLSSTQDFIAASGGIFKILCSAP